MYSHGAGHKTKTLSDLVDRIEYVDPNGTLQSIPSVQSPNDDKSKQALSVASGCFGLLGVVTHITLRLEQMSVAEMKPTIIPLFQAIPLPSDMVDKLPSKLKDKYEKEYVKDHQKNEKQYIEDFERRAKEDYYAEWFWFPLHDDVWVNTWGDPIPSTPTDTHGAKDYPSEDDVKGQLQLSFATELAQENSRKTRLTDAEGNTKALCKKS